MTAPAVVHLPDPGFQSAQCPLRQAEVAIQRIPRPPRKRWQEHVLAGHSPGLIRNGLYDRWERARTQWKLYATISSRETQRMMWADYQFATR